jgi:acetate kinase
MNDSHVLTVNTGSSSLRAHLVDPAAEKVLDHAEIEHPADTAEAHDVFRELLRRVPAKSIAVIAHRLVHGGPSLREPAYVDARAMELIREASSLAPMHNPKSLKLIEFLNERLPGVPQVVCPDTAFHDALPRAARAYALPHLWRAKWDLHRYGFHGLSYAWALRRTAQLLDRRTDQLNLLIAHLSGGSSVCAVRNGRSVDTSMGFTPLEGIPMSRRSGTVDPGMLLWLLREGKLSLTELEEGLHRESGLYGLSDGRSGDTRDLVAAAARGDAPSRFALEVYTHRVRRELGAMAASLPKVDAIVFTGDIGLDQPEVVESVCGGLGILGIAGGLSRARGEDAVISPGTSKIPVLVVRSREELQLAAEAIAVYERR